MSQRQRPYCDARGFVVDALSHGNPGKTEPTAGGYSYHITESGKFETGPFSMQITGLKPGTKYYYRACAHNAAGWSYGDEVSFATEKAGAWKKIRSYLEVDYLEVGFPLGIKARFKRKGK